jgi:chemotaxis protein methyltransferase CheR
MVRPAEPAVSERDVSRFRDLLRARTGMAFPLSRSLDLKRAVRRSAAEANVDDAGTLYDLLAREARPSIALDALVSALNVSETHFFRDSRQMQALEQRILPGLIARRMNERRLRIWSAGCSTGEEAYTLAILLDRMLPDIASWDVFILGTDINGRALERARQGVYGRWSLRGTQELVRARYLPSRADRFEVLPRIRAMATFGQLNLVENLYPSLSTNTHAMDLILCRNVLLYFEQEAARALVGRLSDALVDGGWLMVSQVEAGLGIFDGLRRETPGTAIYRKVRPGVDLDDWEPPRVSSVVRKGGTERALRDPPSEPTDKLPQALAPSAPGWRTAYRAALLLWRAALGEDALRLLEQEEDREPMAAPLHYLRGLILLETGHLDQALRALRRCTCADPDFAPGHLAQASLFVRLGLGDRARIALENTARLLVGLQPDDLVLEQDGLTAGDVLDLVNTHRALLGPDPLPEDHHG